jgi:hypothetical protein
MIFGKKKNCIAVLVKGLDYAPKIELTSHHLSLETNNSNKKNHGVEFEGSFLFIYGEYCMSYYNMEN